MKILAIKFDKFTAIIFIFHIIINKLCYWKKLGSNVLIEINNNLRICFYYTTIIFGLGVHLKIENNSKFLFNTKKIIK